MSERNRMEINQNCVVQLARLGVKMPDPAEVKECLVEEIVMQEQMEAEQRIQEQNLSNQAKIESCTVEGGTKAGERKTVLQEEVQAGKWLSEVTSFIRSYDFMRLGQAAGRGQWQSAAMTIRRMDMMAKKLGAECFLRQFAGLKQAVARKNAQETKQILVAVTAKRVKIIEVLNEREQMLRGD